MPDDVDTVEMALLVTVEENDLQPNQVLAYVPLTRNRVTLEVVPFTGDRPDNSVCVFTELDKVTEFLVANNAWGDKDIEVGVEQTALTTNPDGTRTFSAGGFTFTYVDPATTVH